MSADLIRVVLADDHAIVRTAPEIGAKLYTSPKTVDTYKQRINEKLGLQHRPDYVKLALRLRLLSS